MVWRRRTWFLYKKLKNDNAGFGLLDTAISLAVVGVMAVAVFKAADLLETARINATLALVRQIQLATQTFQDRYGALPGDLKTAQADIGNSTENGKGDGSLKSVDDAKRFWDHLTKGGFVNLPLSDGLPTSKLGGVLLVLSNIQDHPGVWLVLAGSPAEKDFKGAVTSEQAFVMDKKGDDGDPKSGDIRAIDDNENSGKCLTSEKYNLESKDKTCVMLFRLS
jgi:type II secretory pathway pseudopilin PulG